MNRILMLDVEALDLQPTAVVLQVGAQVVELSPYKVVFQTSFWPDLEEQKGRTITADTVLWWMQQKPEAQRRVMAGHVGSLQPNVSRAELFKTVSQWLSPGDWGFRIGTVWAKPAGFDLTMLTNYFGEKPWGYRQERCLQTVARLLDPEGNMRPPHDESLRHDAQYDADWQCCYLGKLYQQFPSLPGWDY